MSLVRSADMSMTSYGNPKLYGSEKHKIKYVNGPSYDPNFFMDSPSEELIHPSEISSSPFDSSSVGISHDESPYQTNYGLEYGPNGVEYDEGKMRLKLQELEHALLDEDDELDEVIIGPVLEHSMDLDGEWLGPLRNAVLRDSPKESSTSSESSNFSSISSSKEVSPFSPRTPKQLLFHCATMISEGNFEEAATMIDELRQKVSIQGDPSQRIAAYMVEGLAARLASSGKVIYKALKCKEPPSFDRLAAMQILFEVCPCFKFGFMAANAAIMEAIRHERKVHIIDFDINQGNQ